MQILLSLLRYSCNSLEAPVQILMSLLRDSCNSLEAPVQILLSRLRDSCNSLEAPVQILLSRLPDDELRNELIVATTALASLENEPLLGVGPLSVTCTALQHVNTAAPEVRQAVHVTMDVLLAWWKHSDSLFLFAASVLNKHKYFTK